MPDSRAGHHGDIGYVFEDAGFDTDPTDTTIKTLGSNAVLDTFEASHQAVRKYNASRHAAEIIAQNFDGAWGASFELSEPPWWLAGVFGQPSTTGTDLDSDGTNDIWSHEYSLSNGNDPVPLRFYLPTDGYSSYKVVPGAWIVSVSVDQSSDGSPEISLAGGYAREPYTDNTLSPSIPDFAESTYSNRHAEVQAGGTTVGKAQNTSLTLETGTEGVNEIGSENVVDYSPKSFEPDVTWDKILWVGEDVDPLQRFKAAASSSVDLIYDNGATGSAQYIVKWSASGSFPSQWSESGRNDSDADLMEELQEMAENATVTVTEDQASPPGV